MARVAFSPARLPVVLLIVLIANAPAAAQEADVRAAVVRTVELLNAGEVSSSGYAPGARVVVLGAAPAEYGPGAWGGAGGDLEVEADALTVTILGNVAVTEGRLSGTLVLPNGGSIEGPWSYSETRVRQGDAWRIAHQQFSAPSRALASPALPAPPPPTPSEGGAPPPVTAGRVEPPAAAPPVGIPIFGPPPPDPPEVIARDDEGNATVRAIRLEQPLSLDGVLDEPVYGSVPPLSDFIQSLPDEGEPATELTEAWVMFDDENVYVSARVHEEVPESEWVANEMRRDGNQVGSNDNFGLVFDTYYDRRNGYFFYTNPLGAMVDVQVTNEGSPNFDWNPVWDVRTGRFPGGWTVEIRLPFKSIRYRPGSDQVWGFQLRRAIRRKNEWSHLTFVSRAAAGASGRMGIIRMSRAATLVGIQTPPTGLNLDIKPYGIAGLTTVRSATPTIDNDLDGDGGVDVKWGVTQNLAADFTYNTDFAQVEVDEQQINLTRFSLFFPEKREFFLESRGIFDFPTRGPGVGGGRSGGPAPTLFFSRRIGLQAGARVPIIGGGRLTGKVGPLDVGALGIQTDALADVGAVSTNFTAVRLRTDILARSNLGALFTNRSRALTGSGAGQTYGADASFSLLDDLYVTGYYARTESRAATSHNQSYQGQVSYNGDLGGFRAAHLLVENGFEPEVGFVPRSGFRQTRLSLRGSPRPASIGAIRQVTLEGTADYFENAAAGFVETRELGVRLGVELENSDQLTLSATDSYENLVRDERITGATISAGRYAFESAEASYSFGPQRFFSGSVSARVGSFYDGTLKSVGLRRGRIELHPRLSVEPSVSFNAVRLPGQSLDAVLALARVNLTFTPRMFLSGLAQYNSSSDTFSTNVRFRWEYAAGSEIFLVWTEQRDSYDFRRFPVLESRGFVIKATRLLRL